MTEPTTCLIAHMSAHPLTTTSDILAAGVRRVDLDRAIVRGDVVRHGQGIMCTPTAQDDALFDNAAACLATGGILCAGTAGVHHGLTDENPSEIEVLVPAGTSRGDRFSSMPIRRVRSAKPESFTVGIEEISVLGTTMRITGKARTVVDLFRLGSRQHAVAAMHTFLAEGGTGDELRRMAEPFGMWPRPGPMV